MTISQPRLRSRRVQGLRADEKTYRVVIAMTTSGETSTTPDGAMYTVRRIRAYMRYNIPPPRGLLGWWGACT